MLEGTFYAIKCVPVQLSENAKLSKNLTASIGEVRDVSTESAEHVSELNTKQQVPVGVFIHVTASRGAVRDESAEHVPAVDVSAEHVSAVNMKQQVPVGVFIHVTASRGEVRDVSAEHVQQNWSAEHVRKNGTMELCYPRIHR